MNWKKVIVAVGLIILSLVLFGCNSSESITENKDYEIPPRTLVKENGLIREGNYQFHRFSIFAPSYVFIDYTGDRKGNLFLLNETNFDKFRSIDEGEFNSTKAIHVKRRTTNVKIEKLSIDFGHYYFVIAAEEGPINYELTVSSIYR